MRRNGRRGPMHGDVLSCGHTLDVPEETRRTGTGAAGYATLRNGKRICYACADDRTRARLATLRPGDIPECLYLSSDGRTLGTWNGTPMLTVTRTNVAKVNAFGGRTERTYVRAEDGDGRRYFATGPGRSMFARVRRAREGADDAQR